MNDQYTLDGERVHDLRIKRSWSIHDLARRAHCTVTSIVAAENGKPVFPLILIGIALALGVDPDSLLPPEAL